MPVPSIPQYLVMKILSPVFYLLLNFVLRLTVCPMAVDTITGLLTSRGDSVCPPIISTLHKVQFAATRLLHYDHYISLQLCPPAAYSQHYSHRAYCRLKAVSFQDIWIDSLPISLTEKLPIRGLLTLHKIYSPKSISRAVSPIPVLLLSHLSLNFMLSNIILLKLRCQVYLF